MKTVVLDTSALMRLYFGDGLLPDGLEEAIRAAGNGDAVLTAPDLLLVEIGSVLLKKERAGHLSRADADEILEAVRDLPIRFVSPAGLMDRALAIARAEVLSVYDALFLALSRELRAPLITADEKLRKRSRT